MDENKVFKKSEEVVVREVGGEVVCMPLYSSSDEMSYIYTFNKTTAALWELIDGKRTLGRIKERLLDTYDVDDSTLTKQLAGTIKDLKSIKAIIE